MLRRFIVILLLISCGTCLQAAGQKKPDPFVLITLQKSGTYLAMKCINMLTDYHPNSILRRGNADNVRKQIMEMHGANKYPSAHFNVVRFDLLDNCLQKYSNIKKIIMVRDLRDVAVSGMNYYIKEGQGIKEVAKICNTTPEILQNMSSDEQLMMMIQNMVNLEGSIDKMLCYYSDPSVFVIRYEDLVGAKGEGDNARMRILIIELARFLNVPLSNQKLLQIEENLYGNNYKAYPSRTFRKGKIGTWKSHFKREHEKVFAQLFGEATTILGY